MKIILLIIFFSLIIELITLLGRLIFHIRNAHLQRKLKWPRIHHSYIGILLFLLFVSSSPNSIFSNAWFLIASLSLIISDLLHHIVLVPLLRRYHYDVSMIHHKTAHHYLCFVTGSLLVMAGFIALVTPLTPGSWLIPIGLVAAVGKRRTGVFFDHFLGEKLYYKLGLNKFLKSAKEEGWRY